MSVLNNTIHRSTQHLIGCRGLWCVNHGPSQRTNKPLSLMLEGNDVFLLPIFNEQNKSYASDRGMT